MIEASAPICLLLDTTLDMKSFHQAYPKRKTMNYFNALGNPRRNQASFIFVFIYPINFYLDGIRLVNITDY